MFSISLLSIGLALAAVPPQGGGGRASRMPASADTAVVEISARLIQADGQASSGASRSGSDTFDGYLWSDAQCALAGGESVPRSATGWKFSTNVVRRSGDSLTVQINWERVGDAQNHGVVERTMNVGDRVRLDRIDLGTTARPCASAVQLEASVLRSSVAGGMGVRGGLASRAGGGRGMGMGATPKIADTQKAVQDAIAARKTQGGGGRGVYPTRGAGSGGGMSGRGSSALMYSAELWLVHTVPNTNETTTGTTAPVRGGWASSSGMGRGSGGGFGGRASVPSEAGPGEHEEVTYQSVRFPATGAGFALPPVSIQTRSGAASLVVMGTLSAVIENGVPVKLVVTVNRQAMGPDQPSGATGRSSTKEMPWPQTGEVISFELPSANGDRQEKLALRLRLSATTTAGRGLKIR